MRTTRFGTAFRTLATLTVVVAILAGCSVKEKADDAATTAPTSGADGSATTGTTTAPADAYPGAKTQGVTADSIKLGAALISSAKLKAAGIDIELIDPEALLKGWIAVQNAAGGVNGRQIDFTFAPYLPVSDAEAQTSCVKLTEDEKVFAVIGQLSGDTSLCVSETHAVPYVGLYGLSTERAKRAKAPFFAGEMADDRQRAASIGAFADEGDFTGKRVALYSQARDAAIVASTVKPALEKAGADVVVETVLDDFGTDQAAIDAAMDTIVEKMKAADAEVVLNVSNFTDPITAFGRKGWAPEKILVTTAQALSEDVLAQSKLDPALLAKVVVAAPYSPPKDALLADTSVVACVDDYNSTKPAEPVDLKTVTRTELGGLANLCSAWQIFLRGAEQAGKDLTAQSWADGVDSIGDAHLPGYPYSSLGPGKHDLGDTIGVYTYDPAAKLFVPSGDPVDAKG